jgi:glutathionyl-hydroquinone reductase
VAKAAAVTAFDEIAIDGAFVRTDAKWREWVRKDGSSRFPPARDRYHLYVAGECRLFVFVGEGGGG